MANPGEPRAVLFDKDLVAFLASIVASIVFFLGFSYIHVFHRSFGISAVDKSYVEVLARGLFLLQDYRLLVVTVPFFTIMLWIYFMTNGYRTLHYGAMLMMFIGASWGAGWMGKAIASDHAHLITSGEAGTVAYCQLKDDHDLGGPFAERFMLMTRESQMRRIAETEDMLYLSPTLSQPPGGFGGQSFAIPKTSVGYCRFVGAHS